MQVFTLYSPVLKKYLNSQSKWYSDRHTDKPVKIYTDRKKAERALIQKKNDSTYQKNELPGEKWVKIPAGWIIKEHDLSDI